MWNFIYQFASPRSFFHKTQGILPGLAWAAVLLLGLGFVWGLVFAPADYQQGDAFRIIYVHVPAAFLSMSVYAAMAFSALLLLVWRIKLAGMILSIFAEIGAVMAFLALVTGSIWGKPMWGTWWIWDARLTSELILFLLYLAMLSLHRTFTNREQGDKMLAILSLVGLVDLPIIHYSVTWWHTLHQGTTLSFFAKPKIATPMLLPLLLCLLGFACYVLWWFLQRAGQEILLREKKQGWVRAFFLEECV